MTNAQYTTILEDISTRYGTNYILRFNLQDGSFVQGKPSNLNNTTLLVTLDNRTVTYLDLGTVMTINVG